MVLGSRPAPNVIQPARPHQAASSRATLAGGAARAAKLGIFTVAPPAQSTDICDQARGRPSLRRNSRPSRGSAALAFPTSGVSTERVRGQHAWSQMHGRLRRRCRAEEDRCPVFASRAASADRYDSTCYRVTRCETGHSCCRAAHWRTRAVVWCDCTAAESGRAFVRRLGSTQPAPLLADMRRVECLSVCRARGGPVWAPRAGTRAGAKRSRCDVCARDTTLPLTQVPAQAVSARREC